MRTQLQLETSIVVGTLLALVAGTTMAVHHWASTAALVPDPLLLGPGGPQPAAVVRAPPVVRPLAGTGGQVHRHRRGRGRDHRARRRPDAPGDPGKPRVPPGRLRLPAGRPLFDDLTLARPARGARGPGGALGLGEVHPVQAAAPVHGRGGAAGILIDGQDIPDVTLASLRRNISYVPQDPQLLHRSIAENICYGLEPRPDGDGRRPGGPIVDYDLVHAVGQAAHVEEFVYALPDGYDTVVGERGLKLSGGQRQRVAIAQAMAKRAPILVLDEATSALDSESEHLVQEALWRLMEDSTALVIAHRLSTIAHMDRIVVFDRGADRPGGHPPCSCSTRAATACTGGSGSHQSGGFLVE